MTWKVYSIYDVIWTIYILEPQNAQHELLICSHDLDPRIVAVEVRLFIMIIFCSTVCNTAIFSVEFSACIAN